MGHKILAQETSSYAAIMELGPETPALLWFWAPNSITAAYGQASGVAPPPPPNGWFGRSAERVGGRAERGQGRGNREGRDLTRTLRKP